MEYWSEHPPAHVLLASMMRPRPLRKKDLASTVVALGGSVSSAPSDQMLNLLKSEHEGREAHTKYTK